MPCLVTFTLAEPVVADATVILPLTLSITLAILRDFSNLFLPTGEPELALDETLKSILLDFLLGDLIDKVESLDVVLEGIIDFTLSVKGRRAGVVDVDVEAIDTEAEELVDEAISCELIFNIDVETDSPEPGGGIKEPPGFIESTDSDLLRFFSFLSKITSSIPIELFAFKVEVLGLRPSPIPADEQRRPSLLLLRPGPKVDPPSAE